MRERGRKRRRRAPALGAPIGTSPRPPPCMLAPLTRCRGVADARNSVGKPRGRTCFLCGAARCKGAVGGIDLSASVAAVLPWSVRAPPTGSRGLSLRGAAFPRRGSRPARALSSDLPDRVVPLPAPPHGGRTASPMRHRKPRRRPVQAPSHPARRKDHRVVQSSTPSRVTAARAPPPPPRTTRRKSPPSPSSTASRPRSCARSSAARARPSAPRSSARFRRARRGGESLHPAPRQRAGCAVMARMNSAAA
jgi:hypothetical protein